MTTPEPFAIPAGDEYPSGYEATPAQLHARATAIAHHIGTGDPRLAVVAFTRATAFPHDSDHDLASAVASTLAEFDRSTL